MKIYYNKIYYISLLFLLSVFMLYNCISELLSPPFVTPHEPLQTANFQSLTRIEKCPVIEVKIDTG